MNQSSASVDYIVEAVDSDSLLPRELLLVRQVAAGDEAAFAELYDLFSASLLTYLARMVGERTAAEDLLQEVFLVLWQDSGKFRGDSQVKTWLFQIAHHKAVSWLRRDRHPISLDGLREMWGELKAGWFGSGREDGAGVDSQGAQRYAWSSAGRDPEQEALDGCLRDLTQQALSTLSPEHRAVVELAFYAQLSCAEIATIVNCPVGTVKSRLCYARRHLEKTFRALDREGDFTP